MSGTREDAPARSAIELQPLRLALGRFATGVAIVACRDAEGRRFGLTANSFSAVSLQPPLVLWSLRVVSPTLDAFLAASYFSVNVLSQTQLELARRFAEVRPDKFDEGLWSPGVDGAPLLAGCTAVFECEHISRQAAGDHVLFIGQVLRLSEAAAAPLIFQSGHYRQLGGVL